MAISDSEYGVIYFVKLLIVNKYGLYAIGCIYDATIVLMDILVICRNCDDNWLFLKVGSHIIVK